MPHGNASQLWNTRNRDIKSIETETGNGLNTLKTPVPNGAGGTGLRNVSCEKLAPAEMHAPGVSKTQEGHKDIQMVEESALELY